MNKLNNFIVEDSYILSHHTYLTCLLAAAFFLSLILSGCSSESETDLRSSHEDEIIDIGEPLAPSDEAGTSEKGLLDHNDGIETLDALLEKQPNVEVLTGPLLHEILMRDGSKIPGEMVDIDNQGSVSLKLDSGKIITIPSSDYVSIRILLNEEK